jgi:hypothetical protein
LYPGSQVVIAFDFPSDWLQLNKLGGGIQYANANQRNGDKLYVLHLTLPDRDDLKSMAGHVFADAVLSPMGDVAQRGVVMEGGRISRSQMIVDCNSSSEEGMPQGPPCTPRCQLVLK